jgi:cytoskeletal protein CcmA (bactofilin family)
LIKGPVFSKEIVIKETGSISGHVEADRVEVHGHLDGKISAKNVIIGSTGVVKGDIEFGINLRTEDGADIDGYIKKTDEAGKKLENKTGDYLFVKSKEDRKLKKMANQLMAIKNPN